MCRVAQLAHRSPRQPGLRHPRHRPAAARTAGPARAQHRRSWRRRPLVGVAVADLVVDSHVKIARATSPLTAVGRIKQHRSRRDIRSCRCERAASPPAAELVHRPENRSPSRHIRKTRPRSVQEKAATPFGLNGSGRGSSRPRPTARPETRVLKFKRRIAHSLGESK